MKINHQDRLYIIECSEGYSCLGFDVLDRRAVRLSQELDCIFHTSLPHGEFKYNEYCLLQNLAAERLKETGKRCNCELHPMLRGLHGERVEVFFKNGTKERFRVGRTIGCIPIYLRLKNSLSTGGPAIDRDEEITSVRKIS